MIQRCINKYVPVAVIIGVFVFFITAIPIPAHAATCSFTRDLELNVDGEDVRCLQKYLNGNGFVIASTGVGSPGKETSLYRQLTKEAVMKWQAKNGLSATGMFGPQSRAMYTRLVSGASSTTTTTTTAKPAATQSLGGLSPTEVAAFLARLNGASSATASSNTTAVAGSRQSEAGQRIKRTVEALQDEDDFEDEDVKDAIETLLDAVLQYVQGGYADASADALRAYEQLDGRDFDEDELDEEIQDMQDALEDARDDVADAEDDDVDVDDAEDLLDEAEDKLDDAQEAYDDEDFSDVADLLDEVEELIADALDEIGVDREDEAQQAIEDAEEAIEEAQDAIEEADDNDDDVDSAEELLDAAEERLDDAQDSFDDEEWADAIEDAEDAKELAEDAIDEL
jgi:peptidoglycan hydrolase-like protein with peptidoglycan-binding domain